MSWWANVVQEGKESSDDRQSDNRKRRTTNVDCPALRNDGFAGLTTPADIVNVENRRSRKFALFVRPSRGRSLGRLSKSGDSGTLGERREFRWPVNADLFQHSELIPVVPALYNLSFVKTSNGDPGEADTLASSGNTEAVAGVSH